MYYLLPKQVGAIDGFDSNWPLYFIAQQFKGPITWASCPG